MSLNFSSGSQKSKIQEPSPEERALAQKNLQIANLQEQQYRDQIEAARPAADRLAELDTQIAGMQAQIGGANPDPALTSQLNALMAKRANVSQEADFQKMQSDLEKAATANLLARATGKAPILTPEQEKSLDEIFGRTQKKATDSLNQFAQEQAGMRGMSTSDSPIFNETLRQKKDLEEGLAASKTEAQLNLGSKNDIFNQNLANFQSQLRNQAFQSRMALNTEQPASYKLQNYMLAQRMPFTNTYTKGAQGGLSGSEGGSAVSSLASVAGLLALLA